MDNENVFGKNLKRIMDEKGISQSRLAFWTDISGSGIFRYISGERSPSVAVVVRFADALDVDFYDLVNTIEKMPVGDIYGMNTRQMDMLRKVLSDAGREIPPVKILRARTGLSQEEFAKKYHQNLQSIRNWESGKLTPTDYTLYLLERNVDMDYAE